MERRRPHATRQRCACGKVRHRSHEAAIAEAVDIQANGRDMGKRALNVYRCEQSGAWHVGHRPTMRAW